MTVNCFYMDCDNTADFIDDMDCYVCLSCMIAVLENSYTRHNIADFEHLNWDMFPENGFSQ